ncbi:hypothetical protein BY996DRAFT_8444291, partial [Phakopsora pachyrhizi]
KHFYIYEPVQIKNGNVVVLIYFYTKKNKLFSKVSRLHVEVSYNMDVEISIHGELDFHSSCLKEIPTEEFWKPYNEIHVKNGEQLASKCGNILHLITEKGSEQISLPNQWRIKADGKLIRHIPLNLYSDDTSGNISKEWNKHISIFMTLSGLPPSLSNQEYHTLFIATSNIASALEPFTPVVEELNRLATTGVIAFDESIQQEVLLLPVALLLMADSPMRAEITSTMQPNTSLQPCRI